MRRALLVGVLCALWAAAPAAGHSVMKVDAGVIHYTANDDVSLNDLSVTVVGSDYRFYDRGAVGGITPAQECRGGEADADGYIVEVLCPRAGITTVRIDVGEAQDKIAAALPITVLALGGRGADTITTGTGEDTLNGGEANDTLHAGGGNDQLVGDVGDDQIFGEDGNDTLQGALGADVVDGGVGDDALRVRDGAVDQAVCGDGTDHVQADADDAVDACETVERPEGAVAPSGGGGPPVADTDAPRLRAGGSTLQRLGRGATIEVLATASEVAELTAAGYVTIGEQRFVLRSARVNVPVGGAGARLRLTLEPRDAVRLRRLLRGRRRARATITVVATDTAGNSTVAKLPRIGLRR